MKFALPLISLLFVSVVTAAPVVVDRSQGGSERAETVEERLSKLERVLEGRTLIEITMRLEELQREVEMLRGETEEQVHQVQNIKQRQRDLYLDIDRRLRELETARAALNTAPVLESFGDLPPVTMATEQPVEGAELVSDTAATTDDSTGGLEEQPVGAEGSTSLTVQSTTDTSPTTSAPVAATTTLSSRDFYRQAFDLLKAGKYDEAIAQFRQFIVQFPTSSFADNAQYWIGEAMYALHRFDEAMVEFQKISDLYPKSAKLPDALLKIGYSQYEKGDFEAAKLTLENLRSQHPNSTAASLAVKRLQMMKIEGQ